MDIASGHQRSHNHDLEVGEQHILVVFHKMGIDREKPTGMDIRQSQIVQSLLALRYTVHFLSHEDVHESQLSPFDSSVIVHTGSLTEQLEQAMSGVPVQSVLLFFTTLTMSVHQRMLEGDEKWYTEPPALLRRNLCSPGSGKELGRNRASLRSG